MLVIYVVPTNDLGYGKLMNFSGIMAALWVGILHFAMPTFDGVAVNLIAPVVLILVAENLGFIKEVAVMTGRNLDHCIGHALIGDDVATMVSGAAGGTGVTTYVKNIGVMAATRIYSTAVFLAAAVIALALGFSLKFGTLIQAILLPMIGGVVIVAFGSIAGARMWVDSKVNFNDLVNLLTAAITLILGNCDFTLKFGSFALGGIGTLTFGAVLMYLLLSRGRALLGRW